MRVCSSCLGESPLDAKHCIYCSKELTSAGLITTRLQVRTIDPPRQQQSQYRVLEELLLNAETSPPTVSGIVYVGDYPVYLTTTVSGTVYSLPRSRRR